MFQYMRAARPRARTQQVYAGPRDIDAAFKDELRPWWEDRRYQIGGGAAALVLLLLLVLPWGGGEQEGTTGASEASQETAEGAPGPTGATTNPAPATARPLEIRVSTERPVWMRVIVDGARRVERQVPANQTLTFGADRTIVLRVGDAGGVRVLVNGVDQGPLGRDGQIAVRTFTPPGR